MTSATAKVRETDQNLSKNKVLRQELDHVLAKRNFVRAIRLAQELDLPEERIRDLQRAAFRQFVMEYQNFEGARQLIAAYDITAAELKELAAEAEQKPELQSRSTLSWQFGQTAYLSIAEQIRRFCNQTSQALQRHTQHFHLRKYWHRLISLIRSWFDDFFTPRHGGFSPGGPAYV